MVPTGRAAPRFGILAHQQGPRPCLRARHSHGLAFWQRHVTALTEAQRAMVRRTYRLARVVDGRNFARWAAQSMARDLAYGRGAPFDWRQS